MLGARCVCSHQDLRRFARAASFMSLRMVHLGLLFLRKLQLPCFCLVAANNCCLFVCFGFPLALSWGGGVVVS